jgi:putative transposase
VNGGVAPEVVHSDRGPAMTSKEVTELLSDLGIVKSHSRPKISNDNPFSEAQFKTLKYCPAFPGVFGSIHHTKSFCHSFFNYYNHEHYHSGIGMHTPFTVHIGTAETIQQKRAATIEQFRAANPDRFTRKPKLPALPTAVWINKPDDQAEDQEEQPAA